MFFGAVVVSREINRKQYFWSNLVCVLKWDLDYLINCRLQKHHYEQSLLEGRRPSKATSAIAWSAVHPLGTKTGVNSNNKLLQGRDTDNKQSNWLCHQNTGLLYICIS